MMVMTTLVLVDDDVQLAELLKAYLESHQFKVWVAHEGRTMWKYLETQVVDLILLDLMLPAEDGIHWCRRVRERSAVPIIMLSALGEEADRVLALEMGADDFVGKPFSRRELLARIKSLLRRSQGLWQAQQKLVFVNWQLDKNKRLLIAPDGVQMALSRSEYDILLVFLENPHRTLTRDQLLDLTQGREATPWDRSIDVLIGRLRKKIEVDMKEPQIIQTVRGVGYCLDVDVKHE